MLLLNALMPCLRGSVLLVFYRVQERFVVVCNMDLQFETLRNAYEDSAFPKNITVTIKVNIYFYMIYELSTFCFRFDSDKIVS